MEQNGHAHHTPGLSRVPNSTDTHRRPKFTFDHVSSNGAAQPTTFQNIIPPATPTSKRILGLEPKYLSLMTLALQNAGLSILMYYSRVSASPSRSYSAASAVLLNEVFKGTISFAIALSNTPDPRLEFHDKPKEFSLWHDPFTLQTYFDSLKRRSRVLAGEIFSSDCWKLSIPAILYVIQNNLQYTASANLDVVVFQVSYQMKILTTAAFSVLLLRKRLSKFKWLALLFLAIGVGIVQIQSTSSDAVEAASTKPFEQVPLHPNQTDFASHQHVMHPFKGFAAVLTACFTSGLAGVYFEMVLKGSKADLWVRNIQLSLFSIIPALAPIILSPSSIFGMFDHFGLWAWATVLTQVCGGLVTALVIKYSDNILKAFATSLSIILSFLASVCLFNFRITPAFVLGSSTVLMATWMYNQSQGEPPQTEVPGRTMPFPGSPVPSDSPILGQLSSKKRSSLVDLSPRAIAASLGLSSSAEDLTNLSSKTSGQRFTVHGNGNGSLSARTPYVVSRTPPISRSQTPHLRDDSTYLR